MTKASTGKANTAVPVDLRIVAAALAFAAIPFITFSISKYLSGFSQSLKSRIVWVLAFTLNLITVSLPGRFDSETSRQSRSGVEGGPWTSLFAPAPWAFAIWGVIYLSELLLTIAVGFNISSLSTQLLSRLAPLWLACNLYQSLWCLTFRDFARNVLWLPAGCLIGAAAAALATHATLSEHLLAIPFSPATSAAVRRVAAAARLPISLHAGWLAAAALLNVNGWAAARGSAIGSQLALAFGSVYIVSLQLVLCFRKCE
jgi:hypothetical protein